VSRQYITSCQVFPIGKYAIADIEEAIQEAFDNTRRDGIVMTRLPDGGLIASHQQPYVPY